MLAMASSLSAAKITLLDGRELEGRIGMVSGVAEDPLAPSRRPGGVNVQPILLVDDGLRRTFVSKRQVREINEAASTAYEKINIRQQVASTGARIGSVGPILKIDPFDEFGRRTFRMQGHDGPLNVIQGITEITPIWTKVEGLRGRRPFVWEMRIATSSLPRDTLSKILHSQLNDQDLNARLKIVRLYLESERYRDARLELETVVQDFPERPELQAEVNALRQVGARRLLAEIELRRQAGQNRLVQQLIAQFPAEGVAGQTLESVREIGRDYQSKRQRGEMVLSLLKTHLDAVEDSSLRQQLEGACDEIRRELNYHTLDRMAAFERLVDDPKLSAQQKVSLAVSGWLLGTHSATENVLVSLSLFQVRQLLEQYFQEPLKGRRQPLIKAIEQQEGAAVPQVAKLVANMKPPRHQALAADQLQQTLQHSIPGLDGELDVEYLVQLPPEYDPHRLYPAIVTLNGAGTTPAQQIDWWAGAPQAQGSRLGQASRKGYVVIAVAWRRKGQATYQYSAHEHHAVLGSLRDAMRRYAIDSDRVFLSGHSVGGDAVWDIGLAHPDLWAGVIPFVSVARRYCAHYWENAKYVPMYLVAGELDGDKLQQNARELDRYLRRGFPCTLVEYRGRGHEHFFDEIHRIMDWMDRQRRDFFPKTFQCATMRPWDNYFWWVELDDFPERSVVYPSNWPPPRGTRPSQVSAKVTNSGISVKTGARQVSLWLTPELVDFDRRVAITVNRQRINAREPFVQPNLAVLLEDVRTRGDRKHPFWTRLDWPRR